MSAPSLPSPGELFHGKYLIKRVLGRGGVGVVYEAEHAKLRQRVAVKLLAPEMLAHPDMVERFEREARAMALLTSPHVTRVIDVDATITGIPFLVMEFLEGHDFQAEIKSRGALTVPEAVHWVRQACAGMAVAHAAGIVHRDLKPANLFLVDEPQARVLKIMDFGISKITGEDLDVTMTSTSLGTPAYMSPEQVRSAKHIDGRADVWSLGVILYRALTGKLPFAGSGTTGMAVSIVNDVPEPIEVHRPDLPPGLVAVVRRTLEKDPNARFPSVTALADALAPFEHAAASPVPASALGPSSTPDGSSLASQVRTGATGATVKVGGGSKVPWILAGFATLAIAGAISFVAFRKPARGAGESGGVEGAPESAGDKKLHKMGANEPEEQAPKARETKAPAEPTPEAPAPNGTIAPAPNGTIAPTASASASGSAAFPTPLVGGAPSPSGGPTPVTKPAPTASVGPTPVQKSDPKPPTTATTALPVLL
jgi:serine/threonine-protein kinase